MEIWTTKTIFLQEIDKLLKDYWTWNLKWGNEWGANQNGDEIKINFELKNRSNDEIPWTKYVVVVVCGNLALNQILKIIKFNVASFDFDLRN